MKAILKACFQEMLRAVDPARLLREGLRLEGSRLFFRGEFLADLNDFPRICLAGAGKACGEMALAFEEIIGGFIEKGVLASLRFPSLPAKIERIISSHPLPDENSLKAGEKITALLEGLTEEDLLIFLTSGGGSSLAVLPRDGITLEDKIQTMQALLEEPLTIQEINCVRKKLSRIKGGGLAKAAYPATVLHFVLSDVVGDDLTTIASGPFSPDYSSFKEALSLIDRHGLRQRIPKTVVRYLESTEARNREEQIYFSRVRNILVGNNLLALEEGKAFLEKEGFRSLILSSLFQGEVDDQARMHAQIVKEILRSGYPIAPPCALLSGGESYLHAQKQGTGGRNLEFALRFLRQMKGEKGRWLLLSAGTDGIDGNSPAAGVITGSYAFAKCEELGLDMEEYLSRSDSYPFFVMAGGLLLTGPTGTNVADVRLILIGREEK